MAGLVDFEHPEASGDLRPALREGVEAGSEDDVLPNTTTSVLRNQILDEASPGNDRRAEEPRAIWVHVRAAAPAVIRIRQFEADLVFQHMRRRVDQHMQRPPEGDPHRRAVRRRCLIVSHNAPLLVASACSRTVRPLL